MLPVLPPTHQTCLATNQVFACCVNTDFLLDKITRESRHTPDLLQNKIPLGGKKRTCTDFVAKSITAL